MDFLYERQSRRFWLFLVLFCVVQVCAMACAGMLQAWSARRILTEREAGAASYLLEKEIPPGLIAAAWNQTEITVEGRELLERIGHTEQNCSYLLLLAGQTSVPAILFLTVEGILFSTVLLSAAGIFLQRRERVYEKAEQVVGQYAEGRLENRLYGGEMSAGSHPRESGTSAGSHPRESGPASGACLPKGESGALCRLFGQVEQLALSLQARGEAEHRSKEFLQEMISNISHQLKTPLAALEMYMEILSEDAEDVETVRKFSAKSMASLERMEQLIQSLLKMARLDTGNIVFEKRRCPVREIVVLALGELRERAGREEKEILVEGSPEEEISCDPGWTKEAVENLVKNALDHTKRGGIIRVTWKRSPAFLRLTVADDGRGIAPEDIHHIFKRFYRSKSSSDRQGAGLGLSLAKAIIEGQGGNLSVESSPGKGSAFHISFFDL